MPEVKLALADASRTEILPAVCVRCGRPASGFRGQRLTTSEPMRSSFLGYLMWELGFWTLNDSWRFDRLMHEFQISRGRLRLPVCWWHRWIMPPFLGLRLVNEREVVISHACEAFVIAVKHKGWVR